MDVERAGWIYLIGYTSSGTVLVVVAFVRMNVVLIFIISRIFSVLLQACSCKEISVCFDGNLDSCFRFYCYGTAWRMGWLYRCEWLEI